MRRAGIVLLVAIVVAGCLGLLGPASRTASETASAGEITLGYDADATRRGQRDRAHDRSRPRRADGAVLLKFARGRRSARRPPLGPDADDAAARTNAVTLRWIVDGAPAVDLSVTAWVMP
ncbi:hypothetical protein [Nocardioides silvaticus]|uniref:hypothetical protein n=1 Tax=Nocardioides silvaticus TaxID=2201891 RepID=UPI0034E07AD1